MSMRMHFGVVAAFLLLAGCAVPREHTKADIPLPAAWTLPGGSGSAIAVDSDWWQDFGDAELSSLVRKAREGSFDLTQAVARIRQAQALARMAGASLLPQIDAQAGAVRQKAAESGEGHVYSAVIAATYEVDVWGGNAATREAALAELAASEYARDVVALTLEAGVASSYLQVAASRERAELARLALAASERILHLVESRVQAGAASTLESVQQRGLVAAQRQALALRRQEERDGSIALALLLGSAPQSVDIERRDLAGLAAPDVSAGVPSELLPRRPDLAWAERRLAAADADVAAVRAAMLPRLALTLEAGGNVGRWRNLLDHPVYSLAAGLMAPLFHAGKLAAGRDLALAERDELLAAYRAAIIDALGDVEAALNAIHGTDLQRQAQQEELTQARLALRLAEARYRWGGETLLAVLDAQRTLYSAQDEAVLLKLAGLQARISLFKALGGGWKLSRS